MYENKLTYIIGALILLLPACALVVDHGASAPFTLLVLIALFVLPFLPGKQVLKRDEIILLLSCAAFFVWAIISMYLSGINDDALKRINVYSRFFTFIPVYFLIRRCRLSVEWLAAGVIVGAISSGLYAIVEIALNFESYSGRASGARHPVYFGSLSLLMACMSLAFVRVVRGVWWKTAIGIAFVMGLIASIFSGTRGAWVAFPVLALVLLWQHWPQIGLLQRKILLALMFLIPAILFLIPATNVSDRFDEAVEDVRKYKQGITVRTSVGQRIEMWRAALDMIKNNAIIGAGTGSYNSYAAKLVAQQGYNESITLFGNPHNEYLNVAATRGIIGLLLLFMVFIVPVTFFYKRCRVGDDRVCACATVGILIVVAYSVHSLSASPFERVLPITFYVFFIYTCAALITGSVSGADENSDLTHG